MTAGKITAFIMLLILPIAALASTQDYQFKKFGQLINQADQLSAELNNYFFSGTDITRQAQTDMFEQKALPELKVYNSVAVQLSQLDLPENKKKIAITRSKLIMFECHLYQLLYAEFKDQDYAKYRPDINEATDRINILKEELGNIAKK